MITLIEKWKNENATDEQILKELLFIINSTKNGIFMFMEDSVESTQPIKYCVPCEVETYGKVAGICYSESAAHDAIREMFNSYAILLLSWIMQGQNDFSFNFKLSNSISYVVDESNAQKEIFDVMIVFSKCRNKVGFYIKAVVPLIGFKNQEDN